MKPSLRTALVLGLAIPVVLAACGRQHDDNDFLPTAPAVIDALALELSSGSIPADGFSKVTIIARVDPGADFRTIVFTTNLGTLLGADSSSSDRKKTVEADITGRAEAQLKSEQTVGRAVLSVEVLGDTGNGEETLISKTVFVEFTRPNPETLVVTPSDISLPADGFAVVELVAQVDPSSATELKEIVFETTLGKFVGAAGSDSRSLEKTADIDGRAVARLTSDDQLTTGVAEITVSLKNLQEVVRRLSVEFLPVRNDFIELSISALSLPADGFSEVELAAQIDPQTPPSLKRVTFTATGGSFPSAGGGERQIEVAAGLDGRAVTRLRSDTSVGTVEIRAYRTDLPSAAASGFVEFAPVTPSAIISLTTSSATAPADGFTRTDLIAVIAPGLTGGNRTVTFGGAVLGRLSATTAVADASNRAVVQVTSAGVLGTDRLTATVNSSSGNTPVTADTNLQYIRALPDSVTLDPANITMPASSDSLRFTTRLQRQSGEVTPGTRVEYSIRKQVDGSPVDFIFQSVTLSDSNGESEATLIRGGSTFTGFAIVRASVPGSAASDEAVIEIQ